VPEPMRIKIPADVVELVRKLHPQIKRKVRAALDEILQNPFSGKQLQGELAALRSFRVGKIRIIYREKDGILEIMTIGRREVIYYETTLLVRRTPPENRGR
jgi:mRNA interferase RelE/StbE